MIVDCAPELSQSLTEPREIRGVLQNNFVIKRNIGQSSEHQSWAKGREMPIWGEKPGCLSTHPGIAFPELHTAAGQLMAELAVKGFLPEARGAGLVRGELAQGFQESPGIRGRLTSGL